MNRIYSLARQIKKLTVILPASRRNATTGLLTVGLICTSFTGHTQSVNVSWQYTSSSESSAFARFNQFAMEAEYGPLLLNLEHRDFHSPGPDNSFNHVAPGVQYLATINEQWAIWPLLYVSAGYQRSITSNSLTYNPQLAGIRQINSDIAWVIGGGILRHTTESVYYPVIGLIWLPDSDSRWFGNLTIPDAQVGYRIDDNWRLLAGLKWQTRFYQADRDSSDTYYFKQQDVMSSLGIGYQFNSFGTLNFELQMPLQREVKIFDGQTQQIDSFKPDQKLGMKLSLSFDW